MPEWHEGQMPADEAFLNGPELGLVGLNVDIHLFELADLVAVAVDESFPVPLCGVPFGLIIGFGHSSLLVSSQPHVEHCPWWRNETSKAESPGGATSSGPGPSPTTWPAQPRALSGMGLRACDRRYRQVGSKTGWHCAHLGVTKAIDLAIGPGHQVATVVGSEG